MNHIQQAPWSEPRLVQTRLGPRYLRTYPSHKGDKLRELNLAAPEQDRKRGLTYSKDKFTGQLMGCLWSMTEDWPFNGTPAVQNLPLPKVSHEGLLPYQPRHVALLVRSLNSNHIAVDNSETGTGKTSAALAACREIGFKPLIVCPKSVKSTWRKWCERMGVEPLDIVNYEMLRTGKLEWVKRTEKKRGLGMYKWQLPPFTCVIFDEAHKLAGRGTLQSKMGADLRVSISKYRKAMVLSATLVNNPMDMQTTGYLLGIHSYGNFWHWLLGYGVKDGKYGKFFAGDKHDLARLHQKVFPKFGGGMTIEVAKEYFPENIIRPEVFDLDDDGKLEQVYREMREMIATQKAKEEKDRGWNPMVEMIRAQQKAEILKIPTLHELAEQSIAEGKSVCIFVNYIETLKELQKRFICRCGVVWGGQTETQRNDCIDAFQADKIPVIILQIQAGGVGISLHQDEDWKRPRTSLICPCFDARALKQALGRIHRSGAKDGVVQRIVYGAGSKVEERACLALERKFANMQAFNSGEIDEQELKLIVEENLSEYLTGLDG